MSSPVLPQQGGDDSVRAPAQRTRFEVRIALPIDRYAITVGVMVLVQACWLGIMASRGWFYADDLSYMSQATGRTLGWAFLSDPLNDHFVPGLRLAFWIINRTTGLNYGITILFRMVLQAVTTLMLYRLLVLLAGRRPGVLMVLGWYALGPLLMPGSVWLTTSVHLMSAQLLIVLAIDLHIRYTVSGRILTAVGSAGCLLGALSFWELSGITVLLLPILSLGFVHTGTPTERLRAALRRWPGWLIMGAAVLGWLALFVSGPYGGSAHAFGLSAAWQVLRVGWLDTVAPVLIGGPWHWFSVADVFFPVADPPVAMIVLAQLGLVVALGLAWRRTGKRCLLAVSLPLLTFGIGTLAIAAGRFWLYGDLSPRAFNYAFVLGVPLALAATLSYLPSPPALIAARAQGSQPDEGFIPLLPRGRVPAAAFIAAVVVFLVSSLVTDLSFDHRWAQNPSKRYVHTLTASVRSAGPTVNLWDSAVPATVLTYLSTGNHISDVLHLAGVRARFQDPGSDPMIVRADGTLAPAGIFPVAKGVQRPHTPCTALVQGAGTWTIPLSVQPGINEYFMKISYLQQKPSTLYFALRDGSGRLIEPVGGERRQLSEQLANLYLRLPLAAPGSLVVRSENLDSGVCIGAVTMGVPVALAGK